MNAKGEVVADSRKKVLSFGKATFRFPGQSEAVDVKPKGVKNELQEFTVYGVGYRCEVEKGKNVAKQFDRVLFKVCVNETFISVYGFH